MTGVIVRSGANVHAGARTRLSAVLHGFWLLLAVGSAPALLASIPTSALAAILVHTGYKLVNIENIRSVARYGRMPLVVYGATVIGIVSVDLLSGVLIGIGLSLAHLVYKVSHLDVRLDVDAARSRADLHLEGAATFVRLPKLAAVLDRVPTGFELHIHFESLSYIDHACMDLLASWEKQRKSKGNRLVVEWDSLEQRFLRAATANSAA
jgi:MFS superfamily sulfate permease-like transporter